MYELRLRLVLRFIAIVQFRLEIGQEGLVRRLASAIRR